MGQLLLLFGLIRAVAVGAVTDLRSCTDSSRTRIVLTFNNSCSDKSTANTFVVLLLCVCV